MGDRYRRLLSSYRPPKPKATTSRPVSPLDIERTNALLEVVRRLLEEPVEGTHSTERRQSFRRPFPKAVLMTPCDVRGIPRAGETVSVVVKDLAPGSVGFVYNRALREKIVLLTMNMAGGAPIHLLTAIRRVQAVRQGLYLVGGEFIGRLEAKDENVETAG